MKPTVDKTTLTKRQIEVLEAVYHAGNPWTGRSARSSALRMLDELHSRHYITTGSIPSQLTVKGLKALGADKTAMKAISQVELDSRIEKRTRIEAETEEQRQLDQQRRDEARAKADEESKRTRMTKIIELVNTMTDGKGIVDFGIMTDDQILDFAAKIADIETIY